MAASSVTGTGHGAAEKNSPPSVKYERLTGPFGPRILMAGKATMSGGEVTVTHPFLDSNLETVARTAISHSAYSVWVSAYNDTSITVNSLETGSTFAFVWTILETGVSGNLPE